MKGVIDRFEGNFAVVEIEERNMINIERKSIPIDAKEGDVIDIQGDKIIIDYEATKKLKKQIEDLTKDLFVDE